MANRTSLVAERRQQLGLAQDDRDALGNADGGAGARRHDQHEEGAGDVGQEEQRAERRAAAQLPQRLDAVVGDVGRRIGHQRQRHHHDAGRRDVDAEQGRVATG